MNNLKLVGKGPPRLVCELGHNEDGLHQRVPAVKFTVEPLALFNVVPKEVAGRSEGSTDPNVVSYDFRLP
jgi:hypothetical protein